MDNYNIFLKKYEDGEDIINHANKFAHKLCAEGTDKEAIKLVLSTSRVIRNENVVQCMLVGAFSRGNKEIIELIIDTVDKDETKFNIHILSSVSWDTILHRTYVTGNEQLEHIIVENAKKRNIKLNKMTPLFGACVGGRTELALKLLDDITIPWEGAQALGQAIEHDHEKFAMELAEALIERNLPVDWNEAIHFARHKKYEKLINLIEGKLE